MINKSDRIFITGASGFVGKHLVNELSNQGYGSLVPMYGKNHLDLLDSADIEHFIYKNVTSTQNNILFHVAGQVGGIGINKKCGGEFFYNNMLMGLNVIEICRIFSFKKLILLGTVCSYPAFPKTIPFKEEELEYINQTMEPTNSGYGTAKLALMKMVKEYNNQYTNFCGVSVVPVNMYGPRDNFNPDSSHVIPAIILKIHNAIKNKEKNIKLWGDGSASREFLHVSDCAKLLVRVMERYEDNSPLNLGTGQEITIKDLANKIKKLMNYDGEIIWDSSQPNGQMRRVLDITKMEEKLGMKAQIELEDGLKETISYFEELAMGKSNV